MKLETMMTRCILTKEVTAPIWEVAKLMEENNIGFVPITDNNRIIGVITDRDICIRCVKNREDLQKPIEEFITKNIVTIDKDETTAGLLRSFAKNRIKRILVTDKENIIGIISLSDVINHYSEMTDLIPTLQTIWQIDKSNEEKNASVHTFKL